jgi:pimeloyl-ACP methyl ester carboxylesterase
VLRVDDRGIGQTNGDVESATTFDFANDALVGLEYLLSRKEVNRAKLGLIGHSEGGMIAQMVAAKRRDIQFVVMLAGPGLKIADLMKEQNQAVLSKTGIPAGHIEKYSRLYNSMLQIIGTHEKDSFEHYFSQALNQWMDTTPNNIIMLTTGIKDEPSKRSFIQQIVPMATSNWFRYFIQYDPADNLKKIRAHVLAINGDKDIQVISKSNLQALATALQSGKARSYAIHELKDLNHLFQTCKVCSVQEYGQLDETFSPVALQLITSWLKKITK